MRSHWHYWCAIGLALVLLPAGSTTGAADEMKAKPRPQKEAKAAKAADEAEKAAARKAELKKATVENAKDEKAAAEARDGATAGEQPPGTSDETPQSLRKKLLARAEISAKKVPLKELLEKLSKEHDIPLRIDEEALKGAGITQNVPITVNVKSGTLNTVLKRALATVALRAVVRDKEVLITTADSDTAPAENRAEEKAAARVRAAPVAAAEEQQIDQQALQFLRQFQSLEKAELFFLSEVCGIDRDVTSKLKAESANRAKSAARKFAAGQQRMMRGQAEGGGYLDARRLVQDGMHEALKGAATPEQLGRYEKQIAERAEYRKGAAIRNLVARLDRELVLSVEQRDKFIDVLKEKWDDNWGRSMQLFMYGEQFYPVIPDAIVLTLLDPMQKEIWRGQQRNQNNIFFNGLGMMGNEIEDFPWDDPDGQPAAEGERPAAAAAIDFVDGEQASEEVKGRDP